MDDRIGTALPVAAPVTGFLTMPERAERCDTTASLVDRLGTPGLKVVEAYSESWGPCGSVAPVLRKFIAEFAPGPEIIQVLVCKAEGNTLLDRFRATSVPHFLFYRNGVLKDTVVGPNIPALERAFRAYMPQPSDPPEDPTANRYHKAPPTPASRPTTGARPRTADLLRQGRAGSVAAAPVSVALEKLQPRPSMIGEQGRMSSASVGPEGGPGTPRASVAGGTPRASAAGPRASGAGAGSRPVSVAGSRPVSVAGSRPVSVAGSRPASAVPRPSAVGGGAADGAEQMAVEGEEAAAGEGEGASAAAAAVEEDAAAPEAPPAPAPDAASEEAPPPEAAEAEAAPQDADAAAEAPTAAE